MSSTVTKRRAAPTGARCWSARPTATAWCAGRSARTRSNAVGRRLGLEAEHRQRLRPDGTLLTWQAAGIELSLRDPWLPFFMQWDDPDQFPGATAVTHALGECALAWLAVSTTDPDRLARWTEGAPDLPLRVGNTGDGIDAVAISTPKGRNRDRPRCGARRNSGDSARASKGAIAAAVTGCSRALRPRRFVNALDRVNQ